MSMETRPGPPGSHRSTGEQATVRALLQPSQQEAAPVQESGGAHRRGNMCFLFTFTHEREREMENGRGSHQPDFSHARVSGKGDANPTCARTDLLSPVDGSASSSRPGLRATLSFVHRTSEDHLQR